MIILLNPYKDKNFIFRLAVIFIKLYLLVAKFLTVDK